MDILQSSGRHGQGSRNRENSWPLRMARVICQHVNVLLDQCEVLGRHALDLPGRFAPDQDAVG